MWTPTKKGSKRLHLLHAVAACTSTEQAVATVTQWQGEALRVIPRDVYFALSVGAIFAV